MGEVLPLSEGEYRVLERAAKSGFRGGTIEDASRALGIPRESLESLLRLLEEKGVVSITEERLRRPVLTDKGRSALERGLPEERLLEALAERGEAGLDEVKRILGREAGVAIGVARRAGLISIEGGRVRLLAPPGEARERVERLRAALERVARGEAGPGDVPEELVRRGLVKLVEERRVRVRFTVPPEEALARARVEVARLSRDLLRGGRWRRVALRRYDVRASPPRVYPARKHFLAEFIEMLRDIMVELGFREVEGPIVELEFYNFDMLFQPQDHPAREIHDTLRPRLPPAPPESVDRGLLERAARVHERGWGYKWSQEAALRLVLRSQTTAVSARVLASRPRPPLRVFTVGRVYRSDVVDATHLPEFHQLDGLDGDYGYTFRDLLGVLREVSARLGLEVKFKPAYFPFTEPSVEGYVRLPGGRWLELFGAGMLRPEVLEIAGIDYPVGAWGFGVERLAAVYYGVSDIRLLYSRDLRFLATRPKLI